MTKLRHWTTLFLAPLWRWKWLFLACLLVSVSYGLGSVAVELLEFNFFAASVSASGSTPSTPVILRQGWPLVYLERAADREFAFRCWPIWRDVQSLHADRLALNLAVALGLSLALTYLVAWRLARWQFRLGDVLVATLLLGGVLGHSLHVEANYQADNSDLERLTRHHFDSDQSLISPRWYLRPYRDLGLLSDRAAIPFDVECYADCGWDEVKCRKLNANRLLIREASNGRRLRSPLFELSITDMSLTDRGVAAMVRWAPSCEKLKLFPSDSFSDQSTALIAAAWPRLKEARLGSPQLTTASLQSLSQLRLAEKLAICDCSREVKPDDLQILARLPNLKLLGLPQVLFDQLTPEQQAEWKRRGVILHPAEYIGLSDVEWEHF
ncbi:hypothetical protein [Blastopirellula marina]|uniref:Leucine Rich repeats (2 copies) n=1 Tax=Blastopirellula marina TaxID=124 RepID=A0A2S8GU49_9BACT|nr:hypothetical protein [Blastopirellula marina]PQO47965.1 hypothetical protein C5Y93_00835 [Blastopirellula marina]